jgi:glutamine synthetase
MKEIAAQHGKSVTFMPKPGPRKGQNIHISLWRGECLWDAKRAKVRHSSVSSSAV